MPAIFVYLLILLLGLILGSYLNCWMWRASNSFKSRRSVCVHCKRQLAWFENIPLFSYLVLRGKCRTCRGKIPLDYFWVEGITGLLFIGLSYYHLRVGPIIPAHFFRDIFFLTILIIIFAYDIKYQIILSGVVWLGAVVGLIINFFFLHLTLYSLLIGLAVGGGFFLAQYIVSRGRWIGGGDVRMGAMMGIWLGWPNILVALFVSYIVGALTAVPLLIFKKAVLKTQIPFGTFLAIGTLVALLWGGEMMGWYRAMVGM